MTRRSGLTLAVLFMLQQIAATAFAQVVMHVEGPNSEEARATIARTSPDDLISIDPAKFFEAYGKPEIGKVILNRSARPALAVVLAAAGKRAGAKTVIVVRLLDNGKAAAVVVIDTADGQAWLFKQLALVRTGGKGRKRRRSRVVTLRPLTQLLRPILAEVVSQQPPPVSSAALAVAATATEQERTAKTADPPHPRNAWLAAAPLFRLMGREMTYEGADSDLLGYGGGVIPMVGGRFEIYPGALAGFPYLGARVVFATAPTLASAGSSAGSAIIGTQFYLFDAELRGRFTVGPATFGVGFGYCLVNFTFQLPSEFSTAAVLPEVTYHALRPSLEVRLDFGPVGILLGGGYRATLSSGSIGRHFQRDNIIAFDLDTALAVQLTDWLELRLAGEYIHVAHALNSEPGDTYQGTMAIDRYFGGELTAWVFF